MEGVEEGSPAGVLPAHTADSPQWTIFATFC